MQLAPKNAVPVFPLPSVVLFPRAVLPLHVFELRYRTMVREALSGERMISLALLKPGWERDYHGSPEFHELGCLARFEEVEWLPNDCYDLKLLGLSRVRFGKVTREYPYRATRVHLLPEEPYSEDDPLVEMEKQALLESCQRWRKTLIAEPTTIPSGFESLRYAAMVSHACMLADASPQEKLRLLELDSVIERGNRVRELLERRLKRREPPEVKPGGEQN